MENLVQKNIISIHEEDVLRWVDKRFGSSSLADSLKGYFRNILYKELFYLARDRSGRWYVYAEMPSGFSAGQWHIEGDWGASMWARVEESLKDVFDAYLGQEYTWQQLFVLLPDSRKVSIHEEFKL